MFLKSLDKKVFSAGNVCVTGLRGTGKDMLFANIVARRKQPYISNVNYHCKKSPFINLDMTALDCSGNNYENFLENSVVPYNYPYPEKCDIWLSDAGIYFPAQYNSQLNNRYKSIPVFQALSRHLGECNFHVNAQNLNRVWDKIREQSDLYVMCNWCKVLGKIVFQKITVYDKYQSCVDRVKPYVHIKAPLLANSSVRAEYLSRDEVLYREFQQNYGTIKTHILIYVNKSKYDTRLFKSILGGVSCEN